MDTLYLAAFAAMAGLSLALAELASQGVLTRPTAGTWMLSAAVAVAA